MSVLAKQSVGEYLRAAREARGISLDEAARETNIAKRYLEALETDQFSFMPAQMYTPGFLSAYAEILELDKDVVLAMYNKAVSKEQEVPLQELYEVNKIFPSFKKEIAYFALGIPAVALLIYLIVLGLAALGRIQSSPIKPGSAALIKIEELVPGNNFKAGERDRVVFENEGQRYTIEFQGIRNKNQIAFRIGKNTYVQKAGDILTADITQNGINDLGIEIIEVGSNSVHFGFSTQNLSAQLNTDINEGFNLKPYAAAIKSESPLAPVGANTSFRLKVRAESAIWLQHKSDAALSQETLLDPGEEKVLSFTGSLVLLIGNAGAAELSFTEFPGVIVRGGAVGETSYSLFYKKGAGEKAQLFRAQLK